MEMYQCIIITSKEVCLVLAVILLVIFFLVIIRKEKFYQNNKNKIDGSFEDKMFFAKKIVKDWWWRNRFLCDVKKKRFIAERGFTAQDYSDITVAYRTSPTDENLRKAQKMIVKYLG